MPLRSAEDFLSRAVIYTNTPIKKKKRLLPLPCWVCSRGAAVFPGAVNLAQLHPLAIIESRNVDQCPVSATIFRTVGLVCVFFIPTTCSEQHRLDEERVAGEGKVNTVLTLPPRVWSCQEALPPTASIRAVAERRFPCAQGRGFGLEPSA